MSHFNALPTLYSNESCKKNDALSSFKQLRAQVLNQQKFQRAMVCRGVDQKHHAESETY